LVLSHGDRAVHALPFAFLRQTLLAGDRQLALADVPSLIVRR
jgi:hypothetical protein